MRRLAFSSELYELDPSELTGLSDYTEKGRLFSHSDEIVLLIGSNRECGGGEHPDFLLNGRELLSDAMKNQKKSVPVRIAFMPGNCVFDILSPFIRSLRYRVRTYGANVYHIDPAYVRGLKIERTFKSRDTAYSFTNPNYKMEKQARLDEWDRVADSIRKNGFSDAEPVDIMVCRLCGAKDCLNNGHHRMAISLDLGLKKIPVRFSSAAVCPFFLRPFFCVFSTWNLAFKRRFGH